VRIETPAWYTLPSVSRASRASDNELKLAMKAQAQNLRYGKFANIAKLEFETCVSLPSGEINRPPYPFGAPAQRSQGAKLERARWNDAGFWQDSGAADNYRVGVVIGALKARGHRSRNRGKKRGKCEAEHHQCIEYKHVPAILLIPLSQVNSSSVIAKSIALNDLRASSCLANVSLFSVFPPVRRIFRAIFELNGVLD